MIGLGRQGRCALSISCPLRRQCAGAPVILAARHLHIVCRQLPAVGNPVGDDVESDALIAEQLRRCWRRRNALLDRQWRRLCLHCARICSARSGCRNLRRRAARFVQLDLQRIGRGQLQGPHRSYCDDFAKVHFRIQARQLHTAQRTADEQRAATRFRSRPFIGQQIRPACEVELIALDAESGDDGVRIFQRALGAAGEFQRLSQRRGQRRVALQLHRMRLSIQIEAHARQCPRPATRGFVAKADDGVADAETSDGQILDGEGLGVAIRQGALPHQFDAAFARADQSDLRRVEREPSRGQPARAHRSPQVESHTAAPRTRQHDGAIRRAHDGIVKHQLRSEQAQTRGKPAELDNEAGALADPTLQLHAILGHARHGQLKSTEQQAAKNHDDRGGNRESLDQFARAGRHEDWLQARGDELQIEKERGLPTDYRSKCNTR
jgi:hypothetical protein